VTYSNFPIRLKSLILGCRLGWTDLFIFEKCIALSIIIGKQLILLVLGQVVLNRLGWVLDRDLLEKLQHPLLLQLPDQEAR